MDANQLLIDLMHHTPKPTPAMAKIHFAILTDAAETCRRAISSGVSQEEAAQIVALLEVIEKALAYYTLELILSDEPDLGSRVLRLRADRARKPILPEGGRHG